MEAPPTPEQLAYAPPPPQHRTRRLAVLAVVLVLVLLGDRYGSGVWEQARVLYWQRQCLAYSPPKDLIAYDPTLSPAKLQRPECWQALRKSAPIALRERPPILFLGERRTTDGTRVLVVVHGLSVPPTVEVIEPAGWRSWPRSIQTTETRVGVGWRHPHSGKPRTIAEFTGSADPRRYVGRPHPTDPTRFVLPLRGPDDPRAIEGWIGDGGRFVSFQIVGTDDTAG